MDGTVRYGSVGVMALWKVRVKGEMRISGGGGRNGLPSGGACFETDLAVLPQDADRHKY